MTPIRWIHLVLDVPADNLDTATRFWAEVSRTTPTAPRGDDGPIVLQPREGNPWLRVNPTSSEVPGAHLDLVVDDPEAAAADAVRLGAAEVGRQEDSIEMRSPAGVLFCLSPYAPEAAGVQDRDHDVLVDQACLDVPSPLFEDEIAFWNALTGWSVHPSRYAEFAALARPNSVPVRLSFQRVGDPRAGVHPDLACRRARIAQKEHEQLGAVFDHRRPRWTVMVAPAGMRYCVTDRNPTTGLF